jgi:hypothetical protein
MARSITEIRESIKQSFVANSELQTIYGISGANSIDDEFSTVSLEAQFVEQMAVTSKIIEDLQDLHLKEVNQRISEMTPGTLFWYQKVALDFQMGYTLVWNNEKLTYEYYSIDEAAKIVKLCAVSEGAGFLTVKLAKLSSSGFPEKLELYELTAFKIYFESVKYAGVIVNYISDDADKIRLKLKVYYNPSILNADGSLLTDPSRFPVVDAVNDYLRLMPFNGVFNVTSLIDSLQQVEGVVNPLFISASAQYGLHPFAPVIDYYRSNAGYIIHDDVVPLDIQYIAL